MLSRISKLMSQLSALMSKAGTAIEEDLADALDDKEQPPKDCEVMRINTDTLNWLISQHVGCVAYRSKVKKIKYVLEPGKGIEAVIYYKKAGDG